MLIYKSNDTKVEDIDSKQGIVKAYYSVNGNTDSDGDIIEPGAGAKTIRERGPDGSNRTKHFKWHDGRYAPGVLQELGEDQVGGFFISKLLKTTLGADTLIEYEAGAITEHSFGYEAIKEDKDDNGINHIKEYKLWEVSTLTAWGANSLTRVDFVKDIKTEADAITALENITKLLKFGNFSDGYLERLEKAYTDLSAIYKPLTSKEPVNTLKDDKPVIEQIKSYEFKLQS